MIVTCSQCAAKYQYDEARFGTALTKKLKCSQCGTVFEIRRPDALGVEPHLPSRATEDTTKNIEVRDLKTEEAEASSERGDDAAAPPLGRRYSLAVILGAGAGKIYQLAKSRTVLGRGAECEIQLPDSEISRRHAMVEVRDDGAVLFDLGSTNGTFVDGLRIENARLASHQEFSLGTTTLMFIVTDAQESMLP